MDNDKFEIISMTQNTHIKTCNQVINASCAESTHSENSGICLQEVTSMQVVLNKVIGNSLLLLSVEALEDVTACFNLSLSCGQHQTQILLKENGKLI